MDKTWLGFRVCPVIAVVHLEYSPVVFFIPVITASPCPPFFLWRARTIPGLIFIGHFRRIVGGAVVRNEDFYLFPTGSKDSTARAR